MLRHYLIVFACLLALSEPAVAGPARLHFVQGGSFDPLTERPGLPAELTIDGWQSTAGARSTGNFTPAPRTPPPVPAFAYFIVQFHGPVLSEHKRTAERAGAELLWYVPDHAFVCRIPQSRVAAVSALPEVRWVGPDQPGWKFCPGLDRLALDESRAGELLRLIVVFFPGEDGDALVAELRSLGATSVATEFNRYNQSCRLDIAAGALADVARIPGVFWVEPYGELTPDNANVQWVDQHGYSASDTSRTVWDRGVTGRRLIVGITDTPMWTGHDLFRDPVNNTPGPGHRKIVRYNGALGADAHGTHTTGTLCGNDAAVGGTSLHDGLAKDARVYFQNYAALAANWDLNSWFAGPDSGLNIAVDSLRALNHSMSLSRKDTFNIYIFTDMTADQFIWNHRKFMHCNSMGNYGINQMGHPVMAKNIISTGGTLNGTSCRSFYTTSSRGPTADGRRKPQLISPGQTIYSASNTTANAYVALSGTSMATPNMTAATALIRDYFRKGFYPTGDSNTGTRMEISAAMNKAVAIVGADNDLTGYTVPDNNVGWGRVDLDSSLYFAGDSSKLWVLDDTFGFNTLDSAIWPLSVSSSSRPLRATLCWSDYPGTMRAARILVNDLDLTLVSPTGTEYKGNVYSGGQSTTGGVHDSINVEECCRINAPQVGTWLVKVRARNVPQGPQPFALACIGTFGASAAGDVGCTRILAPAGAVDSTATVTPACSTWNFGTAAASYTVRMRIGTGYNQTATVTGHAAGAARHVTFPPAANWPRGTLATSCSTELSGDIVPANDRATGSVAVAVADVGARSLVLPLAGIDSGSVFVPACTLFNRGTAAASYPVRLTIGSFYDRTANVATHAAGSLFFLQFPACTARVRGVHPAACSTRLTGDMNNANDRLAGLALVDVNDVGLTRIVAPAGVVDSGASIAPACSVRNNGTLPASFSVRARIGAGYDQSVPVTALPAGASALVSFPAWTALERGAVAVRCSVDYSLDRVAANDTASGSVLVRVLDAAAVTAPTGTVPPGRPFTPRARVRNAGNTATSFTVKLRIGAGYADSCVVTGLGPQVETEVAFADWTAGPGVFATHCSVALPGDVEPANDLATGRISTWVAGWAELEPAPLPVSNRPLKDGAWLAYEPASGQLYLSKGNKQADFYACRPGGSWRAAAPWTPGNDARMPYKGSAGCADGNGKLYATKGNNSTGFYAYSAERDSWRVLPDIPLGLSNKKVKGGTDLVYVPGDTDYVYLLKGYKTEFYRYNIVVGTWQALADAPAGAKPKYDKGSWLVYDEARGRLLAHKAKYQELYAYDLATGTWGTATGGMPLFCFQTGRNKKSKDGGDAAILGEALYALKGGNTQDFYSLDLATLTWGEKETIPAFGTTGKKKRVKGGGGITTDGTVLYATKGNKTLEVWRYVPGELDAARSTQHARTAVQGVKREALGVTLLIQTPSRGSATIRWSGPSSLAPCPSTLSLYDASGRLVLSRSLDLSVSRSLSLPVLRPGVYLVRVTGGAELTRKLVIE
ncbi:MAG: S8 family serine peptidase [bacterium]